MTTGQKVYQLPNTIAERAVGMTPNGEAVSLREAIGPPRRAFTLLPDLDEALARAFVVRRLAGEPGDREIWMLGGSFRMSDVVRHVQEGTELGQAFVRMERLHVDDMVEKTRTGRYVLKD